MKMSLEALMMMPAMISRIIIFFPRDDYWDLDRKVSQPIGLSVYPSGEREQGVLD